MAAMDDSFSFCPSNALLINHYLRKKIDGADVFSNLANAAYFHDEDVCSAPPDVLVRAHTMPARVPSREAGDGHQFYFFTKARFIGNKLNNRSRTIKNTGDKETWHAEGSAKPVDGTADGYMTKLSYHVKTGPKTVEKPGWIMTEYSFKDTKEGDLVLCKVYKSPRGPGRSKAPSSPPAMSDRKRKAADDLEEATPSTRPRQNNENHQHAAVPEFGAERSQTQAMPASSNSNSALEDIDWSWFMPESEAERSQPHLAKPASSGSNVTLEDIQLYAKLLLAD